MDSKSECVENGQTEAGRGKDTGMSPKDMEWSQIISGREVPDWITQDSIFNENRLKREEWEVRGEIQVTIAHV